MNIKFLSSEALKKFTPWFRANGFDPHTGRIKPHFANASSMTMFGFINLDKNMKPRRTKREKYHAKSFCRKGDDGAYHSKTVKQIGSIRLGIEPDKNWTGVYASTYE